eukprot:3080233-Pleurochrysis_carterae.AAC.1
MPPPVERRTVPTEGVGGESPYFMEIRRLTAARDAARAARAAATATGGRANRRGGARPTMIMRLK